MKQKYYSELIGSKNDNIQVLPSEIQEFPFHKLIKKYIKFFKIYLKRFALVT